MNALITNLSQLPVGISSSFKKIFDDLNTYGYLDEIAVAVGFAITLCILVAIICIFIKKRGIL